MDNLFKVRVGVVIFDDTDRLLLARQNRRPFWILPGGTLEKTESMEECAVREIKEEANLDIALSGLLYLSDFFALPDRHIIDVVFAGKIKGGIFMGEKSENIDEIGFYTMDKASLMPLKPERIFHKILDSWDSGHCEHGIYLGSYS